MIRNNGLIKNIFVIERDKRVAHQARERGIGFKQESFEGRDTGARRDLQLHRAGAGTIAQGGKKEDCNLMHVHPPIWLMPRREAAGTAASMS